MFVVTRRVSVRSVEEAAKKVEAGLVPILKRSSGFRGYHIIDAGDGVGMSIGVFESREAAEKVREEALAWLEKNMKPFYLAEPVITTGEVIVSVQPEQSREASPADRPDSGAIIH